MNLYIDPDDIKPEFQQMNPREIKFEHLTEDVQKVAARFGTVYLPMGPYVGPYVEINAPKSALFEEDREAGLFKLAKLTVKAGDVIILKGERIIDENEQAQLKALFEEYFPFNKAIFIAGMDIGIAEKGEVK